MWCDEKRENRLQKLRCVMGLEGWEEILLNEVKWEIKLRDNMNGRHYSITVEWIRWNRMKITGICREKMRRVEKRWYGIHLDFVYFHPWSFSFILLSFHSSCIKISKHLCLCFSCRYLSMWNKDCFYLTLLT